MNILDAGNLKQKSIIMSTITNKKDHNKYRRDKPWDTDDIDHWEVSPWRTSSTRSSNDHQDDDDERDGKNFVRQSGDFSMLQCFEYHQTLHFAILFFVIGGSLCGLNVVARTPPYFFVTPDENDSSLAGRK